MAQARVPDINGPGVAAMIPGGAFQVVKVSGALLRSSGRILLDGAGALTVSLQSLNAGADWAGDDNDELEFIDVSGHAHVIKDAADSTLVTLGGSIGANARLVAYNGAWILLA